MQLLAAMDIPDDDLTHAQRALLDGVALLTRGELGCWADALAVCRWARAERSVWISGGGVAYSLERRGLIETAWVQTLSRPRQRKTGPWSRAGQVIRLTYEGSVEQFAGAA